MSKIAKSIIGIVVGVGIGFGIFHFATAPSAKPGEYISKEHGFGLIPPEGWTQIDATMGMAIAFRRPAESDGEEFGENINLVVEELPANTTLEQYIKASEKFVTLVLTDVVMIESADFTIAGRKGYVREFTSKMGQLSLHQRQAFVLSDDKAYVLTATATPDTYNEFADVFDDCFASLRLF